VRVSFCPALETLGWLLLKFAAAVLFRSWSENGKTYMTRVGLRFGPSVEIEFAPMPNCELKPPLSARPAARWGLIACWFASVVADKVEVSPFNQVAFGLLCSFSLG
jgi:hypothetical protein